MINLAAALKRRKLAESNRSSRSNVNTTQQRCFLEGNEPILINILSRLPVESLMKFKSVCRRWIYLIKLDNYLINLHFTSSQARLVEEHTFLLYPTCPVYGTIPIKKFWFCKKDLRYDDGQGGLPDTTAVVNSSNMTLDQKWTSMLEPVYGLICLVRVSGLGAVSKDGSVLIYNPSTREKTPWIETLASADFRNLFGVELVEDCEVRRLNTFYAYMFGFGLDLTTNQHKVLCICIITSISGDVSSCELYCGVFTVGDNTWRKIDQVPTDIGFGKDCVYIHGSLYWMVKDEDLESGLINVFDLGSEMFRLIVIPNFILHCWNSIKEVKLVHELVEIDGCLAILIQEGEDMLHLWTYKVNGTGSSVTHGSWISEKMQLPSRWDQVHNLAFKTIIGTSLVVIKFIRKLRNREHNCESFRYYDRREKKYYRDQFLILWEPTPNFSTTYSVTPFFETLLPVQTLQHKENNIEDKQFICSFV